MKKRHFPKNIVDAVWFWFMTILKTKALLSVKEHKRVSLTSSWNQNWLKILYKNKWGGRLIYHQRSVQSAEKLDMKWNQQITYTTAMNTFSPFIMIWNPKWTLRKIHTDQIRNTNERLELSPMDRSTNTVFLLKKEGIEKCTG